MGAWGLGLFQSDTDYDIISDLSGEAGLRSLEETTEKKAEATKSSTKGIPTRCSLYRDLCSCDVAAHAVRDHLNGGALATLIAKWQQNAQEGGGYSKFYPPADYHLIIIGACAMTHGCHLEPSFLAYMRRTFRTSGLMRNGLLQMHAALNSTTEGYRNDGTPYDFNSPGLNETMQAGGPPAEDQQYPGSFMINVLAPHGVFAGTPYQSGRNLTLSATKEFPDELCGACGDDKGEGEKPLMACTGCKKKKYCGKDCQKKHWKQHKGVCKA